MSNSKKDGSLKERAAILKQCEAYLKKHAKDTDNIHILKKHFVKQLAAAINDNPDFALSDIVVQVRQRMEKEYGSLNPILNVVTQGVFSKVHSIVKACERSPSPKQD